MSGPEVQVDDETIRRALTRSRTIAVVGASPKPERASNRVMRFLIDRGHDVVAVNPGQAGGTIHGRPCYAGLRDVPHPVDMVDVFRSPDAVPGVVDDVLALDTMPSVLWLQLGVVHETAEGRARDSGVTVISDRCPKIEVARLRL